MILQVAVPSPLRRWFDYLPPKDTDPAILQPGMRLRLPFGRRTLVGVLCAIRTHSAVDPARLKAVLAVLDSEPLLPAPELRLLLWAQQYYHHAPGEVIQTALPKLLRQGQPAVAQRQAVWQLTTAGQTALAEDKLNRAPKQREVAELLQAQAAGVSAEQLRLIVPNALPAVRQLLEKGWVVSTSARCQITPRSATAPRLSAAQQQAIDQVDGVLGRFRAFLLDGVTGSGKTEVYLQLIERVIQRGEQILVLVPEISLTPQLLHRFECRLPVPLAVLHSALSARERLNAWLAARSGEARVVIGTRSAVFVPLQCLGLILIDEEHDPSFKQQEGFRYHARDLAVVRAQQAKIPVLLGSATPALESVHNVARGRYQRLALPERVGGARPPHVQTLDLRGQTLDEGLALPLIARIRDHLQRGEQALLFVNRRGYSPTLMCHECGWLGNCQHCDARLTLHLRRQRLICHHCGHIQPLPRHCPDCGSVDLRALGEGTERIEQALQRHFPEVGIARIDRDSTRRRGSLQQLLDDVHGGVRPLLLGTQMLAKGHHFPEVTLVAIINADQGLFSADYRASERLAQMIVQVAGRAGRAEKPGVVLIQTHHPQHPLLQQLAQSGYAAFATQALAERQATQLPPYTYQVLLRAEAEQASAAQDFLAQAAALGQPLTEDVEFLGPVPAPMERRAGRYRAQLLLQAHQRLSLHSFLQTWLEELDALPAGRRVRWSVDVDPIDLF